MCFETWKTDFAPPKAWGMCPTAVENQARLAIVTRVLVALLLRQALGADGCHDLKALRRIARRQAKPLEASDGNDRPHSSAPLYRNTSNVSRQALRFFRHCFLAPASLALYELQLRRLLISYLLRWTGHRWLQRKQLIAPIAIPSPLSPRRKVMITPSARTGTPRVHMTPIPRSVFSAINDNTLPMGAKR